MIYLCRHGESEFNLRRELRAVSGDSLTPVGRKQAHALGFLLQQRGVSRVISSPEKRAIETGEIISEYLKSPVEIDYELRERDYGKYEGIHLEALKSLRTELGHKYLDVTLDWEAGQGVELINEVFRRVNSLIYSIKSFESVTLISHAGVIFSILNSLFNFGIDRKATVKIANGAFVRIDNDHSHWTLYEIGHPKWLSKDSLLC
jgi:phosphoserine phosphatase